MKKDMHCNSLLAYWSGEEGMFGKRELLVLDYIKRHGPCTDREVMAGLGATDPNFTRPRISGLIDKEVLEEVGEIQCPITHKTVRIVAIARDPRLPQREFEFVVQEAQA